MAKNLEISVLLDFYGTMLTDKQRDVVELYYNEDLSLAEIAAHSGITRQGVRDSIKRAEAQLLEYEERLTLAARFHSIQLALEEIAQKATEIHEFNLRFGAHNLVDQNAQRILELASQIEDEE
ncbi:MAG: putative DNA-binding protein [Angelakisella sp.]